MKRLPISLLVLLPAVLDRVRAIVLLWIVCLPAIGGEDVLVAVVPASLDNLARVRLVLFDSRVRDHSHIVVHIEAEQWT